MEDNFSFIQPGILATKFLQRAGPEADNPAVRRWPCSLGLASILVWLILTPLVMSSASATIAPTALPDSGWPTIASGSGPSGIDFLDAGHGWVAGSGGYAYRTADGGATWTPQWTGTRARLTAVDFVDSQFGWAVGSDSTVVLTRDGGETWEVQVAPTGAGFPGLRPYVGVSFVDRTRGWVVSPSAVLGTADGGRSWTVSLESDQYELHAIQFVDDLHGWVAGRFNDYPTVWRTADGGLTWKLAPTGGSTSTTTPVAIDFVDTLNGWVVSEYHIAVTHDGGVTWTVQTPLIPNQTPHFRAVSFADRLHGYLLGLNSYRTDDGGSTWVKLDVPLGAALAVTAVDAGHVRAAMSGNAVMVSEDSGQHWTRHRTAESTTETLHGVQFLDQKLGWVVGDNGTIRRTDDGGTIWANQSSGTTAPLNDVRFTDRLRGAAVGGVVSPSDPNHGVILTTVDGGATWVQRTAARPSPFNSVYFADALHGWVASEYGVDSTSDGGSTWSSQGTFAGGGRDVFFLDLQQGYVVGGDKVHRTQDGGATWTEHQATTGLPAGYRANGPLTKVGFTDPTHGWAAGDRVFSRTSDGGLTWTAQELWTYESRVGTISDVAFTSPTDGWAVTTSGHGAVTQDAGLTWRLIPTTAAEEWRQTEVYGHTELHALSFADSTHGWAVGGMGSVLRVSMQDEPGFGLSAASEPAAGRPLVLATSAKASHVALPGPTLNSPTGTVEITQDGNPLGSISLVNGQAQLTTAPLAPGRHVFMARYLGDAQFGATPPVALRIDAPRPVRGWGYNGAGALGTGTTTDAASPVQPVTVPANLVVSAAAGGYHSLAVTDEGELYAWGWDFFGQLGVNELNYRRLSPTPVPDIDFVRQAAAGFYHSLAVTADGRAWAWGWNGYGQLGMSEPANPAIPTPIPGLDHVVAVAGGGLHSLALKADGTVWAWGWNGLGQLGDGTTTSRPAPAKVAGLTGVVAISAGWFHNLALKADGSVWAWGWNATGQLGDGTTIDRRAPVRVPGLAARSISGGLYHSLAARTDGSAAAWGWNGYGQLGDGTTSDRRSPVAVLGATGTAAVAAGAFHSVSVDNSGAVRSWGWNSFGQLGDGTTTNRLVPVQVPGVSGQGIVAAGGLHTLAM